MDTDRVKEGVEALQRGISLLSGGPLDYTLGCLLAAREALLTRYAPFRVGDRVVLAETPRIDEEVAYGWLGSKHFLVAGAAGVVRSSDVRRNGQLTFDVEFDDESWVDRDGNVRPVSQKHVYCFGEKSLTLVARCTPQPPAPPTINP